MELTEQMSRILIIVAVTLVISFVITGILACREMNGKKITTM